MQERQAALFAVASQLWQGRSKTASSSLQQSAPARTIPSSSWSQGLSIPADAPATAITHPVPIPTSAGIQFSTSAAIPVKQDREQASEHQILHSQSSAEMRFQPPTALTAVGQQGQSERESRAAARTSRLAQTPGIGSAEGRLSQPADMKGNSEGQNERHTQASPPLHIPQLDGPADGDEAEDEKLSGDGAVMAQFDAQLQSRPAPAVDTSSTAAARSGAMLTQPQTVRQAQAAQSALLAAVPGLPAPGQTALGFLPAAAKIQPASSSLRSIGNSSALQQMAARYLSSASAMHPPPTVPAMPSISAQHGGGHLPPRTLAITSTAATRPAPADQQAQPSGQAMTEKANDNAPEQRLRMGTQHAQRAQQGMEAQQPATAPLPAQQATAQGLHEPASGGSEGPSQQSFAQKNQVVCPCSGRKYHFGCLPKADQAQVCQTIAKLHLDSIQSKGLVVLALSYTLSLTARLRMLADAWIMTDAGAVRRRGVVQQLSPQACEC